MVDLVAIVIENGKSPDVFTLARSGGLEFRGMSQQIIAALQIGFRRAAPQLVIQAESFTPVRHGAGGVARCDLLELVLRHFIFE